MSPTTPKTPAKKEVKILNPKTSPKSTKKDAFSASNMLLAKTDERNKEL